MPRYDYSCAACGHRFEAVQPITAEPLDTCPECGGAIRRVIGAVGVAFKGPGFYRTDSRSTSTSTVPAPAAAKPPAATTSSSD